MGSREVSNKSLDVQTALLTEIGELVSNEIQEIESRTILNLAEAYAWLHSPGNPHGAGVSVKTP